MLYFLQKASRKNVGCRFFWTAVNRPSPYKNAFLAPVSRQECFLSLEAEDVDRHDFLGLGQRIPHFQKFLSLRKHIFKTSNQSALISQQIKKEGLVSVELTGLAWSATLYKCLERGKYCATVVTYLKSRF